MSALTRRNWVAVMALAEASGILGCTGEISGDSPEISPTPGPRGGSPTTPAGTGSFPTSGGGVGGSGPGIVGSGPGVVGPGCKSDPVVRLPPLFRSLTGEQYRSVLRGAFPSADAVIKAMPNPWRVSEYSGDYTTNGTSVKMNPAALDSLLENTQAIAGAASADLAKYTACLSTLPAGSDRSACLGGVVDALLGKLFNGQVIQSERTAKIVFLSKLIDDFGVSQALKTFASTVMMSPRSLFRSELGKANAATGQLELTARELAEALSFSIGGTRPDVALLAAIEDGNLSVRENREHAQRLARAVDVSGAELFVAETLTLPLLAQTTRTENGKTDALPVKLRAALELEAMETIKRMVRSDGSLVQRMLTSDVALGRLETLALHGASAANLAPDASGFYSLPAPNRRGLLLQPSMMTLLATEDRTDPVRRGNFILTKFMCNPMPDPPPNVPTLSAVDPSKPQTVRQRLETVHKLDACQVCHKFMDPIGLSFEAFDLLGRERTTELGRPVDTRGSVGIGVSSLDGNLANAQELMSRMSKAPEVQACVSTQAFTYLSGVDASSDRNGCLAKTTAAMLAGSDGNIVSEIAKLLSSDLYRLRYAASP